MVKILHFADAHIDMANYGRHDPQSGLPLRVMDFLKSLDVIVHTAIDEKVDLVLFAGDAYKDRNPAPTFQREWGKRIMELSRAGIPTLLLVGNHDLSPALGRAHALDPFVTLEVPNVLVLDRPKLLGPDDLFNLPLQVIALPWISRSGLIAFFGSQENQPAIEPGKIYEEMEQRISELILDSLDKADPTLPTILLAHVSVQGATFGMERMVMLGADLVLPGSLVRDPRLDYVALGHIHKPQDLNEQGHHPVIYPGSIERVDFGEAHDEKFFIIANVERDHTEVEWRRLDGVRPFVDCFVRLESDEDINGQLRKALPPAGHLEGAVLRMIIEYPRYWEAMIDEAALRSQASGAFEFHLVRRPQMEARIRLPGDQNVSSLNPMALLDLYWRSNHTPEGEIENLSRLAKELIDDFDREEGY